MNGPFFKNISNQQPQPKVVSVPIHFVSSDQPQTTMLTLKELAAVKIQKVFRGFVIRKSVRKIGFIRNEVCEMERRIEDIETVEIIRNDAKERVRVNETIMGLLFKLDSIRGVDCGIRELRKGVTKKAVALQEKVDSIGLVDDESVVKEVVVKESVDHDVDVERYKGDREILESLMDDNEKMMRLMTQMSERNEMQTRVINSLSLRVEQLEKALVSRKKRKAQASLKKRREKDGFTI